MIPAPGRRACLMKYEPWFDRHENKVLLAICARRIIRRFSLGAIIWGAINALVGLAVVAVDLTGAGPLVLGIIMIATGVRARKNPSLKSFFSATVLNLLLFAWNLSMTILILVAAGVFDPRGLVVPLIIAVSFYRHYRGLAHIEGLIDSVTEDDMKKAAGVCRELLKKKARKDPTIIQTSDIQRRCRAQLLPDRAFFVQRDMTRAFVAGREDVASVIVKPSATRLRMHIKHPLGKLRYYFGRKSSDRIRAWFAEAVEGRAGRQGDGTQ